MREHVRGVLLSAGVGIGIVYLITVDDPEGFRFGMATYGAMIGGFAYPLCAWLTWILRGWLASTRMPAWLARAVLYFFGGVAAWLLANWLAAALGLVHFQISFAALSTYFPVAGAIAVLIGLLFYAFGMLQGQLEKSVARLKEAEFAEKELELARAIQQRILPPPELSGEGYRISARNLPAHFVAGDFYDFFRLPDDAVGVVVADVAGKGMGASLIMATVKAVLPFLAAERSAAETLREGNRRLKPGLDAREFVALAYVRYEPETGAFTLSNAGLPDPYVLGAGGSVRSISVPGPRFPLGVRPEVGYESVRGVLAPGEKLLLVSDGLPEAPMADGGPLGYERFEALLAGYTGPDALLDSVRAAAGPVLADDWTLLVLERPA